MRHHDGEDQGEAASIDAVDTLVQHGAALLVQMKCEAKMGQTWSNISSMMLNQPSGVDHVSKRRGLEAFGFASSLDSTGFAAFLASGEIF